MRKRGRFSTPRGEAARHLLQAVQDCTNTRNISGKISFVFGNREAGQTRQSALFLELGRNTLFRPLGHHKLAREFTLVTSTLQPLSRGEISIADGRVTDAQGRATSGYKLTCRVDQEMREIWT